MLRRLLFALMLPALLCSSAVAAEKLVVATNPEWPPMEFLDDNKNIIGYDVDMFKAVAAEAGRAGQFHVTNRWMGGTLTNFVTIQKSIERLKKLESMFADGSVNRYQKKEILSFQRELDKLNLTLGGIKDMDSLPQLVFIIDPHREEIAVKECRKLGIPIVAVTDTNCDPDVIDYIIPGNDDAIRAIKLFVNAMAEACLEGAAQSKEVADPEAAMQKAAETAEAAE